MPELLAWSIFRQVLDAVGYLHARGFVHLDLKDENIIIDEEMCVKLIDFGSARSIPSERGPKWDWFDWEGFQGTKAYAAPEILEGALELQEFVRGQEERLRRGDDVASDEESVGGGDGDGESAGSKSDVESSDSDDSENSDSSDGEENNGGGDDGDEEEEDDDDEGPFRPKVKWRGVEQDVYALGVLLYVLLESCVPFGSESSKNKTKDSNNKVKNGAELISMFDWEIRMRGAPLGNMRTQRSQACVDLLKGLLEPDVSKRLTMEQIARHRWVVGQGSGGQGLGFGMTGEIGEKDVIQVVVGSGETRV
jgi:serine/threonine protein kinase